MSEFQDQVSNQIVSTFAPKTQALLHHPGWWVPQRDTFSLSHFLTLNRIEWMMQLSNQAGPGVPHVLGRLPSGMHELKQLKSIQAIPQQEYNLNQVKLIPSTCCGDMGHLAGQLEIKQGVV